MIFSKYNWLLCTSHVQTLRCLTTKQRAILWRFRGCFARTVWILSAPYCTNHNIGAKRKAQLKTASFPPCGGVIFDWKIEGLCGLKHPVTDTFSQDGTQVGVSISRLIASWESRQQDDVCSKMASYIAEQSTIDYKRQWFQKNEYVLLYLKLLKISNSG